MKKPTNRLPIWWIVGCAWGVSLGLAHGQDGAQTQARADALFARGEYATAAPLYDRLLFFSTPTSDLSHLNLRLAASYFQTGAFDRAAHHYDAAYYTAGSDSVREAVLLQKGLSLLLAQKPQEALVELLSLPASAAPRRQAVYLGLTYFLLNDFDAAEAALLPVADETRRTEVADLLARARRVARRYRSSRAQWLSAFVPGLGQLYVGDVRSAVNSALINGLFATLFVTTVINYGWLSGIVTVVPWLQRYYVGGIRAAGQVAQRQGENRRRRLYLELVDVLADSARVTGE